MRNFEIDSSTNLSHILRELKALEENGLELTPLPGEKTLLDNPINKAIIEKAAKEFKKEVVFPASPLELAPEAEGDDMGFIEGEDIVARTPIEDVHQMIQPAALVENKVKTQRNFPLFKNFLKNKWFFIASLGGIIILILLGVVFVLPSAEVNIVLTSESKDLQVTLTGSSTQKSVNTDAKIVPLQSLEITKDGSDQADTTGKKTIGTVATGRVTITNQDTTSEKVFLASTTVLTPVATSSATFKLANDVTVEKAPFGGSSSVGVNVTATTPGVDGNLSAGTLFKINSISNLVFAKNDVAFSGGATKQVTIASSEDRASLKTKLLDKLQKDAKTELEKKTKGTIIIDDSLETTVTSENYDPKTLDSEASVVKLNLVVKVKAIVIKEEDLKKIVITSLESSVKDKTVDQHNLKVSAAQLEKNSDGTVKLLGKVTAKLVAKLDENEIKRNVVGKNLSQVGGYLDSLKNIDSYSVSTSPSFLRFLKFMPFSQSKIKVNLTSK